MNNIYLNETFCSFLPNKYKIFKIVENFSGFDHVCFYISDKKLNKFNLKKAIATIEIIIDHYSDCEIGISSVSTQKNYRGNGIASFLILLVADYCKNDTYKLVLDDMSDNFMMKNNLYTNLGFRYIVYDSPEMKTSPKNVISYLKKWENKYIGSGFF